MQLGSSHLSGTPPRGLPARRAGFTDGADGERTAGRSQDAHVRESGSGEAPQGAPKNSSSTPESASLWTSATPPRAPNWPLREAAAAACREDCKCPAEENEGSQQAGTLEGFNHWGSEKDELPQAFYFSIWFTRGS